MFKTFPWFFLVLRKNNVNSYKWPPRLSTTYSLPPLPLPCTSSLYVSRFSSWDSQDGLKTPDSFLRQGPCIYLLCRNVISLVSVDIVTMTSLQRGRPLQTHFCYIHLYLYIIYMLIFIVFSQNHDNRNLCGLLPETEQWRDWGSEAHIFPSVKIQLLPLLLTSEVIHSSLTSWLLLRSYVNKLSKKSKIWPALFWSWHNLSYCNKLISKHSIEKNRE